MAKRNKLPRTAKLPGRRAIIDGVKYLFLAPGIGGDAAAKRRAKPQEYQPEHIMPTRGQLLRMENSFNNKKFAVA